MTAQQLYSSFQKSQWQCSCSILSLNNVPCKLQCCLIHYRRLRDLVCIWETCQNWTLCAGYSIHCFVCCFKLQSCCVCQQKDDNDSSSGNEGEESKSSFSWLNKKNTQPEKKLKERTSPPTSENDEKIAMDESSDRDINSVKNKQVRKVREHSDCSLNKAS